MSGMVAGEGLGEWDGGVMVAGEGLGESETERKDQESTLEPF